jgi:protein-L-isoaspartate(D-aspartate) O-methyltransferase
MERINRLLPFTLLFAHFFGSWGCAQTTMSKKSLTDEDYLELRRRMVRDQIENRGIREKEVLEAMRKVPRHQFVPVDLRHLAYEDGPLGIGQGQTISQPYIVALMTELSRPRKDSVVLEIGTGSGYQAAVLSLLVKKVCTIEYIAPLGEAARDRLTRLQFNNVEVRVGDGYEGWPEPLQFDAVLITAAINHAPPPLIRQLKPGGRLVMPMGDYGDVQWMTVLEKKQDGKLEENRSIPVQFVPFLGEQGGKARER